MSTMGWLTHPEIERAVRTYEPILPGWHLFPVQGKRPVTGLPWMTAASADPVERAAMADSAYDGWAVACGPSSLLAVDIDLHDADGYASWCGLLSGHGVVEHEGNPRVIGATPSGGRHLYYSNEAGIGNRVGIVPGVDIRGVGGYVVLSGPGRSLTILDWAFPPAPKPLLDLLAPTNATPNAQHVADSGHLKRALLAACDRVASAQPGSRNDVLNWASYRAGREAVSAGIPQEVVELVLLDAARECGLADGEALRTIRSGLGVSAR